MPHRREQRATSHVVAPDALTWLLGTVWLYQGAWCKVAGGRPDHSEIVAAAPLVGPGGARATTIAIGVAESTLAAWVISRRAPRVAAVVQTVLLTSMNASGWWFARNRLAHPRRMLARNALILTLIWVAATGGDAR
jgi:uncharacterized membrane protein YphA (DoxX/SURF4 family)